MTPEEAFQKAVKIVGGGTALAKEIGASKQQISQWKRVPERWVMPVADAVRRAKEVLRRAPTEHDLRPDLYPRRRK
jgi:DNA-binding transcriptional regulator YdaS (Cro superfamily)